MRLKLNKANKRLARRQESYARSINELGFVNASHPKGIGHNGYRRPGSAKK